MKIIGYFTSWDNDIDIEKIDFNNLTHINYAFLIPKNDGTVLDLDFNKVSELIEKCHKNKIQVFISVGGWCYEDKLLNTVFENICDNQLVYVLVENILKVVKKYNFDGVDIDWEFPSKKYVKAYEHLITLLNNKLKIQNKGLSIATPSGINIDGSISNIEAISDKIINLVDWINLMIYDNSKEENHSSLHFAEISLDFWLHNLKCPNNKLILGVPFYSRPSNIPYNQLIKISKTNSQHDNYQNEFYNSPNTISKKAKLVKKAKIAGIMIWALNYDTYDNTSLLKAINIALKHKN